MRAGNRQVGDGGPLITTAYIAPACAGSSSDVYGFVRSPDFVPFMRSVLSTIEGPASEGGLGLWDYGIKIFPVRPDGAPAALASFYRHGRYALELDGQSDVAKAAEAHGFIVVAEGDSSRTKQPPPAPSLAGDDLDLPIRYTDKTGKDVSNGLTQRDIVLAEGESARVFRDAQGRAMYVVVLKRFVRRLTELTDEALQELWSLGAATAEPVGFQMINVNLGGFQNVAHLHLKFWFDGEAFDRVWAGERTYEKLKAYNALI